MLCAEDRIDTAFFSYEPGSPGALIHNDHLATPQKMTDGTGAVVWAADYKPFGEVNITTNTITNNLRFPGQYYDAESGLNYNYYRDYNAQLDRYNEADPVGLRGGINLYLYAGANSIRFTDPRGLLLGGSGATIGNPPGTAIGPQPPAPGTCTSGCHPGMPSPSPIPQCKKCTLNTGEFNTCLLREYALAQVEADACAFFCAAAIATPNPYTITACAICVGTAVALTVKCYNESCH